MREIEEWLRSFTSILIVDDDDDLRWTLESLFSVCGYKVRTAADGFSALEEMGTELPDVLISDLEMPRMTGFEPLVVVREHFPDVKVIAMKRDIFGQCCAFGCSSRCLSS